MKNNFSKKGFSLIEVILAISILSTLAVLCTQALSRALKAKTKIQAEVDDVSALRDSMRMIRTDLNLAYHHRDFEKEIFDLVTKVKKAPVTAGVNPNAPVTPPRKTKRGDPETHFVADDEKMSFITLNNGRMATNQRQADFIEVGYSLKGCRNLSKPEQNSKCLYRRTQAILDEDILTGGNEVVMLENVTEFKLRYWGGGKTDWATTWNSTKESTDQAMKGNYPDIVEVSLSIEREVEKKKRSYSMQFVIPIHFPNNAEKSAAPDPTQPAPAPTGGG